MCGGRKRGPRRPPTNSTHVCQLHLHVAVKALHLALLHALHHKAPPLLLVHLPHLLARVAAHARLRRAVAVAALPRLHLCNGAALGDSPALLLEQLLRAAHRVQRALLHALLEGEPLRIQAPLEHVVDDVHRVRARRVHRVQRQQRAGQRGEGHVKVDAHDLVNHRGAAPKAARSGVVHLHVLHLLHAEVRAQLGEKKGARNQQGHQRNEAAAPRAHCIVLFYFGVEVEIVEPLHGGRASAGARWRKKMPFFRVLRSDLSLRLVDEKFRSVGAPTLRVGGGPCSSRLRVPGRGPRVGRCNPIYTPPRGLLYLF